MDSHQDIGKGKEAETLQGKDKGKDKKKDSSKPTEKASDTTISQPEQAADLGTLKAKVQAQDFYLLQYIYFFIMFTVFVLPFS